MTGEAPVIYLSPLFPGGKSGCTISDALIGLWERGWAVICPSLLEDWMMRQHADVRHLTAVRWARGRNETLLAGCDALFLMPGWGLCDEGHALYDLAEQYGVGVFCASAESPFPFSPVGIPATARGLCRD